MEGKHTVNKELRQARIDRRWSINEAARRIGISRLTYIRWEQGTQTPHNSTLMLACHAFNLSPEKLGFGDMETRPAVTDGSIAHSSSGQTPDLLPFPLNQAAAYHLTTQAFLQQQELIRLADMHGMMYDCLEVEIITNALQWRQSDSSPALLQQFVTETIRNYDTMHEDHDQQEIKLTRRHALQAIAMLPVELYGLHRSSPQQNKALDSESLLPLCAAGLVACRELRQYESAGMQVISQILSAYLPALEELACRSTPSQRTAAHLAAQSYLLLTILADHYGKFEQMEAASRMARMYGQIAGDPNLEVSALARLAVKFDYERRDIKALETYQEAMALPEFHRVSPLLQGRIYAGLAGTHAYCQHFSQALSFLSRAREIYPADPKVDPTYLFAYSGESTFSLWEGLTLKHTGRYKEAAGAFLRYGSLTPKPGLFETNRAEFLNYAGSVAIRQRDLEASCFYVEMAEEIAWSIHHEQRYAEIRDTVKEMKLLWANEPEVKRLQEKMYERHSGR